MFEPRAHDKFHTGHLHDRSVGELHKVLVALGERLVLSSGLVLNMMVTCVQEVSRRVPLDIAKALASLTGSLVLLWLSH